MIDLSYSGQDRLVRRTVELGKGVTRRPDAPSVCRAASPTKSATSPGWRRWESMVGPWAPIATARASPTALPKCTFTTASSIPIRPSATSLGSTPTESGPSTA